jgi:hypothetical protein
MIFSSVKFHKKCFRFLIKNQNNVVLYNTTYYLPIYAISNDRVER